MINFFKNTIKNDSQLVGIHSTIQKNHLEEAEFGTILSIYLSDYIKKAIELSYQGPFKKEQSSVMANYSN